MFDIRIGNIEVMYYVHLSVEDFMDNCSQLGED